MSLRRFDQLIGSIRKRMGALHDRRTGKNTKYTMEDIGLGAFAVFYTQCPSFLAAQEAMEENKGRSNAQTLFQIEKIPCDNHIRDTLDEVPPEELYPLYDEIFESLREQQVLRAFQTLGGTTPIALDGTWYFSSENLHCDQCSTIQHQSGSITYYHSAITPVIVAPGQKHAIALRPEFIVPQDGHDKQDCETAAAKRWLDREAARYLVALNHNVTYLGDDLYARQPFCRRVRLQRSHFIFTCKPDSHTHLYSWIAGMEQNRELRTVNMRVKDDKGHWEQYTYRYANDVPLVESADALKVNWCEVTITGKHRKTPYHNAWVTDWKITDENVASIVATGRCRWKIENENNNTLKTKGYHLEHNFGHGKHHLSSLLAAMNMLAHLTHTFLSYCDEAYRLIRAKLPTRKTFFEHIRALMHYIDFPSWEAMMDFMMRGLEIGPYAPTEA
jgi:hypothetical protein